MDFKSLLQSMDNINENTVHKAGPGGYGNRYGSETQTDQYGKPIGKVSLASLGPKDDKPAKRGRPVDPDKPKTGKDDPKNKKVGDIFGRTTGNVPKSKKGRQHTPMKDADKAEKKAEKAAKKGLKEYVEEVETNQQLQEAEQVTIAPAQQNTQVIKQGQKVLGTVTNPQLAAQIKQSIGRGEMSLNPGTMGPAGMKQEQMAEEGGEKWIKGAIKHPGAFTKKAKAHGMSTSAFANKVLSNKEDYPAKTEKQANLAKTLAKMHESKLDESVSLSESPETLQHIINKFKHEVKTFMHTGELDNDLYDALYDYYVHAGEMPYGVQKSRTGDPQNWVTQKFEQDLPDHVEEGQYTTHGMNSGPKSMEPSRIQTPNKPVPNPTPFSVDPINATTDRAINFISGLRKPKQNPFEGKEMKDVQLESWESQLNSLLTEGITVSSSTGQQGSPDSVSITATDDDASSLMSVLRNAGIGGFGAEPEAPEIGYGVAQGGEEEPTGTGTEPQAAPEVVGDDGDMLALMKKMAGLEGGDTEVAADGEEGEGQDYKDEEGSEEPEGTLEPAGEEGEESEEGSEDEEQTDEGNAFSGAVAKAKSDGIQPGEKINVGGKEYPVKEDDMEEGNMFTGNLAKARAAGKEEADLDGDGDMEKVHEGEESCNECGMYESECECDHEQVDESDYANSDDDQHMQDLYYMINTITGGLNGKKRDQTVLNPTQVKVTESDDIIDWKKLSGIK